MGKNLFIIFYKIRLFFRFKITIKGNLNESKNEEIIFDNNSNEYNFQITESLRNFGISGKLTTSKCFTLFSYLDRSSRNFKINLEHISINLKLSYKWFPLHLMSNIFFAFHSPNSFPSENDITGFDYRTMIIQSEYNQISLQLLGNSYDTNCYEYDLDYKFANFNMRSDCIQSCIQKHIEIGCKNQDLFTVGNYMFRNTQLKQKFFNYDNQTSQYNIFNSVKPKCEKICRRDCSFEYFVTQLKGGPPQKNQFYLILLHNSMPDIVVKYIPQTTFLSMICNLGGLLGMFLGLSFLTIFENTFKYFHVFIQKQNTFVKQESNINNNNITNLNLFVKRHVERRPRISRLNY